MNTGVNKGLPERVTIEQSIEAPQANLVLPKKYVGLLPKGKTIFSVKHVEHWMTQNVAAVTITDFTEGQPGQSLYILGDGFTTLLHGTNIFLVGAANLLLTVNMLVHLMGFKKAADTRLRWYQI